MNNYLYLFAAILLTSCISAPDKRNRDFDMGMIYWPIENASDSAIQKEIGLTIENSDILTAQIAWNPHTTDLVQELKWVSSLSERTNRKLVINIDWMSKKRNSLRGDQFWTFQDEFVKEKFIKSVVTACNIYQPEYINLAVEINYLALLNPEEFRSFINVYNYSKLLIDSLSLNTKVGVTFQLQLLAGTHSEWLKNPNLSSINAFGDNIDYIGISTYPSINHDKKINILQLDIIEKFCTKNIAIFETSVPTIKYSQSTQYSYLKSLLKHISQNPRYELLIWTSTIDVCNGENKWEYSLGLINCDHSPKESYHLWKEWYELGQ